MRLPLPSAARGRVLVVGGLYIDVVSEVAEFPREDSACRALATWRSRGGNASNTAVVLAELLGEAGRVAWMGAVPSEDDPDTAFVLEAMRVVGVDTRSLEPVGGDAGQPRAIIVLSRATGTRTIISSRQGLRELSPTHFARALDAAYASNAAPCWVHFECRELPSVLHCAEAVARARDEAASPLVSLEVEKPHMSPHALAPLLPLCDVVFLSKEWTLAQAGALQARACAYGGRMRQSGPLTVAHAQEKHGRADAADAPGEAADVDGSVAVQAMRSLRSLCACDETLFVCAWGASGAREHVLPCRCRRRSPRARGLPRAAAQARSRFLRAARRCMPVRCPAWMSSTRVSVPDPPPRTRQPGRCAARVAVGAGDTFIAASIGALVNGANVEQAGTAAPHCSELHAPSSGILPPQYTHDVCCAGTSLRVRRRGREGSPARLREPRARRA